MITLEGVMKRFEGKVVLSPTTLSVAKGTSLALLGPSGCGKSTLLRLILGLLPMDAGRLCVEGVPVNRETSVRVRRQIGYVIQDGGLFPHLSARENVTLLARHLGWTQPRLACRLGELAALVRLD